MTDLHTLKELREDEGLSKETHLRLEDIVRKIRDGGECIRLEECNIDVD